MDTAVKDGEIHCKHVVTRKKRFCRMEVKEGEEYCAEHIPSVDANNGTNTELRIKCPLDPKQYVTL